MRKLINSTFVTLDGVVGRPEKWGAPYWNDEHEKYGNELLFGSDALLLGRETYETFAGSWPKRKNDDYADRMNELPKYVASNTLTEATWNATVISGDVAVQVAELKEQPGLNILKFGTGDLDRTLLEHGLLDELHLWVFPAIYGSGTRLLDGLDPTHFKVVDSVPFGTGIVVLTLVPK